MRDPVANYHKMTPAELAAASPGFPVATYLDADRTALAEKRPMVVRQPEFFRGRRAPAAEPAAGRLEGSIFAGGCWPTPRLA
jgi:hypothetical protein